MLALHAFIPGFIRPAIQRSLGGRKSHAHPCSHIVRLTSVSNCTGVPKQPCAFSYSHRDGASCRQSAFQKVRGQSSGSWKLYNTPAHLRLAATFALRLASSFRSPTEHAYRAVAARKQCECWVSGLGGKTSPEAGVQQVGKDTQRCNLPRRFAHDACPYPYPLTSAYAGELQPDRQRTLGHAKC